MNVQPNRRRNGPVADPPPRGPTSEHRAPPLTLRHVPEILAEEPAYAGDELMDWHSENEPPPEEH